MRVVIHPAVSKGAVLEVVLGELEENDDEYRAPVPTVNDALKRIPQHAFGGDMDGFRFEGTNIVMEPARILLIKGTDQRNEWSDKAVERDVRRILRGGEP